MRIVEFDRFKKVDRKTFIAAIFLTLVTFLSTLLMYKEVVANNFIAFFSYPVSIFLLIYSFKDYVTFKFEDLKPKKKFLIALIIVSVIYFMFHFYNYDNAPWNNYGLFDDAAWDIYDMRLKCFKSDSFEIIFFFPYIALASSGSKANALSPMDSSPSLNVTEESSGLKSNECSPSSRRCIGNTTDASSYHQQINFIISG